ncbi:MAG: M20/M25/M40 family metallo-hydrolase, partial [Opitutaceae bacterium]|nr:M20/M25/M40 family metallo-hydrolase [Opitutaceae bacterium]
MAEIPQTCEALLAGMVAIDTVNPDFGGPVEGQARLAGYLEAVAEAWGMRTARREVSKGAFNLIVSLPQIAGASWLLFESHLDTVSLDGMTVPPLTLTAEGTRLHGRGSCDTKGSGAAMLWALKNYAALPGRRLNAGVVFVVDEESSMTGAQAFAAHDLKSFGPLIGIVVGEPTQLRPVVAHNGALRW